MVQQVYKKGDFISQQYEIVDVLGEGGFGIVYLVYHHDSARAHPFYALKTFKDELLSEETVKDRFRKEAQVWVDMGSHPYLVTAFFVGLMTSKGSRLADRLFIASEYIAPEKEGGPNSLDAYLKLTSLDLVQSLRWAVQFCHGMEYAYSKGIRAHRDIKPSNIMIDHNMTVKITDFGLASIYEPSAPILEGEQRRNDETNHHTMLGTSVGTPEYMSPEQFTDFSACDERSDIYSFGVVLFQMASGGKLPFSAENTEYRWMALKHMHNENSVPKLNSPLFPVIQKCTEKESQNRYPSFEALRADLEAILKRQTGEFVKVPNTQEQASWEWNNRGISFSSLSKFEQAIECFDKAINIDPRNSGAWSNKGDALRYMGKDNEAMGCYNNAIKINPSNARAWSNKGFLLCTLGQLDDSIQCLHRALDITPIYSYIASKIVGSLNMGEFKPAEIKAVCQKVVSLNWKPFDVDGLLNLGLCYLQIEDTDNALAIFLEAEKLDGQDSGIWFELMEVYFKKQDADKTIEYCDKLIAVNEEIEEATNKKSRVLSYAGRSREAILLLQDTLKNNPHMDFLWFTLSEIQEQNKNYGDALESAENCLNLLMQNENKNQIKIQRIRGKMELLRRKTFNGDNKIEIQKALQQLKKAEAEHNKQKPHVDAIKQLVQLYLNAGDKDNALYYCDMLIKTTNYITDFGNTALVMSHFGDYVGAVALLKNILQERPHLDMLWYVLSTIHEQQGDISYALQAATKGHEILMKMLDPDKQNIADVESRIHDLKNKLKNK